MVNSRHQQLFDILDSHAASTVRTNAEAQKCVGVPVLCAFSAAQEALGAEAVGQWPVSGVMVHSPYVDVHLRTLGQILAPHLRQRGVDIQAIDLTWLRASIVLALHRCNKARILHTILCRIRVRAIFRV